MSNSTRSAKKIGGDGGSVAVSSQLHIVHTKGEHWNSTTL